MQRAQALNSIYLRPLPNLQGGHKVYHIPRQSVTEIPISQVVIKAVETIATRDGINSLKFSNHSGTILYNLSVPAGVGT